MRKPALPLTESGILASGFMDDVVVNVREVTGQCELTQKYEGHQVFILLTKKTGDTKEEALSFVFAMAHEGHWERWLVRILNTEPDSVVLCSADTLRELMLAKEWMMMRSLEVAYHHCKSLHELPRS